MELHNWFPSVVGKEEHPEWIESCNTLMDKIFNVPNKNVNSNFYYNGETTYGTRSLVDEPDFAPFINFIQNRAKEFLDLQGFDSSRVPWKPYFSLTVF